MLRDQKGLALVFIALILVVICGFLGLAIDMGYMYVAKGQLQNAADSAALAGASQLPVQNLARTEAVSFAARNIAAGSEVSITESDVTLGNFNRNLNPQYEVNRLPVNAVQVQARRTEDSGDQAKVDLFFSNVFGWSQMGASATAIAQRAPKAGYYFVLGRDTCNTTSLPLVISPGVNNMAWTSLLQVATNANDVKDGFMCPADKLPDEDVCGLSIYTTNGTANSIFQAVEVDFYDPGYDAVNKTFDAAGNVSTWTVIIPVATVDDPTAQPTPQPVWGYARIRMIRACGTGTGNPCQSTGRLFTAPGGVCTSGNEIVVDQISCVDCTNSSSWLGVRPNLVQ